MEGLKIGRGGYAVLVAKRTPPVLVKAAETNYMVNMSVKP